MALLLVLGFDQLATTIALEGHLKSRARYNVVDDEPQLTIGEVARQAGLAASSIRYYEAIGLLPPPDRVHGQRRYDGDVIAMLAFISVAQSAGFKLEEIKQLRHGVDDDADLGARMRDLSSQKLGEIEALLRRAEAMKGWLEVAQTCGCQTLEECALFPQSNDDPTQPSDLPLVQVVGGRCRREPAARASPSA